MATDTELAVDRCPVCGHRSTTLATRLIGGLIVALIAALVVLGLGDLVVLAASHL